MSQNKQQQVFIKFEASEITERSVLKRFVTARDDYKCSVCNLRDWWGTSISLQLDHIDGNASNNMPDNLRLICPNCHSQTPTFGNRNKGNGRKSRGISTN